MFFWQNCIPYTWLNSKKECHPTGSRSSLICLLCNCCKSLRVRQHKERLCIVKGQISWSLIFLLPDLTWVKDNGRLYFPSIVCFLISAYSVPRTSPSLRWLGEKWMIFCSRGLRYHFFRYRYDTDTFQVWKVDTDTILILYKSEVLIPILILIPWSSEIRYRYWYWYSCKKDWYQLWYQFFGRNSHFFYQK